MGVIIIRPRAVIRQVLSEPLNRSKLSNIQLEHIDAILLKNDEDWTDFEFHYLWHCGSMCDAD